MRRRNNALELAIVRFMTPLVIEAFAGPRPFPGCASAT